MDLLDAISAGLTAVGGASILAAILPRSPRFAMLFRVIDLVAANWMQARNVSTTPAEGLDAAIARHRATISPSD